MTSVKLRKTAADYLHRILNQGAYLNIILTQITVSRKFTPQEKTYLTETITGVVTWRKKLEWILSKFSNIPLQKLEHKVSIFLLIGLYNLQMTMPEHAALNEVVQAVKQEKGNKTAGFVNGLLRTAQRKSSDLSYPDMNGDPVKSIAVQYSHPEWMIHRWVKRYGIENTQLLCEWNNTKHPTSVRVNPLKYDYLKFIEFLKSERLIVSEWETLRIYQIKNASLLFQSHWFFEGYFAIQSAASALAAYVLDPKPGETVIDLCSAPGGKATCIAELMNNSGSVVAVDINKNRLHLLKDNIIRLGITCVSIVCCDGVSLKLLEADRILVDVPCSGLGTLHLKPDIRWNRKETDFANLEKLQYGLLSNAAKLVRPGGTIVYSTCTIEPEENEQIVQKFIANNPDFIVEPISVFSELSLSQENSFIETMPFKHQFDGSFIAKLKRIM